MQIRTCILKVKDLKIVIENIFDDQRPSTLKKSVKKR